MMRYFLLSLFTLLVNLTIYSQEQLPAVKLKFPSKPSATIQRIVETREGHKSCWGVLIELNKLSFKKTVKASELSIIEQKHDKDIKNIMIWHVDKSRHKLTIKFKKGCGDFGTGDIVDVTIKSSAIIGSQNENIKLSISTDL